MVIRSLAHNTIKIMEKEPLFIQLSCHAYWDGSKNKMPLKDNKKFSGIVHYISDTKYWVPCQVVG